MDKIIDCNDIASITKVARSVVFGDWYSDAMVFICELDGVSFIMKMTGYQHPPARIYGTPDPQKQHANDAEIAALHLLREHIILPGISPCIIEILASTVCNGFSKTALDYANQPNEAWTTLEYKIRWKLYHIAKSVSRGTADDKISCIALERCDNLLSDYIKWIMDDAIGETLMKSHLFMLIYTLYAIDKKFPGMRHRDIHLSNIGMIYDRDFDMTNKPMIHNLVTCEKQKYAIPYYGHVPKIFDFGFVIIPSHGIESEVSNDRVLLRGGIKHDMGMLLGYMYQAAGSAGLTRIVALVNRINPLKHHARHFADNAGHEDDFPSLETLLANNVFDEYRVQKTPANIYKRYTL